VAAMSEASDAFAEHLRDGVSGDEVNQKKN
jgi:hypothetical protein